MQRIYCISGLGADQRVFANISLKNTKLVHVPWVTYRSSDTVTGYAAKMSSLIKEDNPIIMGVSFGGILTTEIAKLRPLRHAFVISGAKTTAELPKPSPILQSVIKILPSGILTVPNPFIYHYFGADTTAKRDMLKSILADTDGDFVKWAITSLFRWRSNSYPPNVIHIHGTNDSIIPSANVHPNHWIEGGTHLMVYDRAKEINVLLEQYVNG